MRRVFAQQVAAVARVEALVAEPRRQLERAPDAPSANVVAVAAAVPLGAYGIDVTRERVLAAAPHLDGRVVAPARRPLAP